MVLAPDEDEAIVDTLPLPSNIEILESGIVPEYLVKEAKKLYPYNPEGDDNEEFYHTIRDKNLRDNLSINHNIHMNKTTPASMGEL